jgi:hypothetical protein
MDLPANVLANYPYYLPRQWISHHHANGSIQTRDSIANPAEKRESGFENVGFSTKSVTIPPKNDVHRRLTGNVRAADPAVKRTNAGEPYIVA